MRCSCTERNRQTGRQTDRETYSLSGNRRGNHKSFKALIKFKIHAVKPQQQVAGGRRQLLVLVAICKYHFNLPQTPPVANCWHALYTAKAREFYFENITELRAKTRRKKGKEEDGNVTALCYSINCYVQVLLSGLVPHLHVPHPRIREMTNVNSDKCHNAKAKQKHE